MSRRILEEPELRQRVLLNLDVVEVIESAIRALREKSVVMPPVLSMELKEVNAEVDIKTAYIPGFDGFAIKVSPGFFDNPKIGLSSLNGLMVVLSARTGLVEAVLLDNGYLTDIRTAAAGAVAAKYLAPEKISNTTVIGAGVQARLQIKAASLVRDLGKVHVWARDIAKAELCAKDIRDELGIDARAVESAEDSVTASELVITTTPATEPVVQSGWLHPGMHITAMGSDQETKNELEADCLGKADLYVCDKVSQAMRLGELRSARAQGLLLDDPPELSDIVTGNHQGRQSQSDITIADLTGMGVQDTAIASYALKLFEQH